MQKRNSAVTDSGDPASIQVFPDGHRPREVLARCGGMIEWEQIQGMLITRGKADRKGRTINYYNGRCPTCGQETRQQRAPTPGQTCETPKR